MCFVKLFLFLLFIFIWYYCFNRILLWSHLRSHQNDCDDYFFGLDLDHLRSKSKFLCFFLCDDYEYDEATMLVLVLVQSVVPPRVEVGGVEVMLL